MTQVTVGSYISLFRGMVNGLEVQRAYTPISPGNAEGYFEVLMKVSKPVQYGLESKVLGTVFSSGTKHAVSTSSETQIPHGLFLCCFEAVVLC